MSASITFHHPALTNIAWGEFQSLSPHLRLKWLLMTDRAKHAGSEPELSDKKHVAKLCQITFRKALIERDLHCETLKDTTESPEIAESQRQKAGSSLGFLTLTELLIFS